MKKVCVITTILFLSAAIVFGQKSATALGVLTKSEPAVKWNAKSVISGDFDYDGVADYAFRGIKKKSFVLGVVKGSITAKSKHWTLELGEDAGDQGGLCSVSKAVITLDAIDKNYLEAAKDYLEPEYVKMFAGLPKGSKGINIADGMCDSFNVFWNKKEKQFSWWRI